MSIGQNRIQ